MGKRVTYRLYRGISDNEFRGALTEVAQNFEAELELDKPSEGRSDLRVSHGPLCISCHMVYQYVDATFFSELGAWLNCPWMEIRIQEGNHWDYSLVLGNLLVDRFSADPSYFDENKKEVKGDSAKLSAKWGVDESKVSRYLKRWGILTRGKAYESDRFRYGDCDQMSDFLRAIGGIEPVNPTHTLTLESEKGVRGNP